MDTDDRCSLYRFDKKIIFQILKKVIDLKTLCICKLVTKQISSIACLVDKVSFTTPLINPNPVFSFQEIQRQVLTNEIRYPFQGESFKLAMKSLEKFKLVKSLHVQLPSTCVQPIDDNLLMKWKLVFGNNKAAPYCFIMFVNSVSDSKGKVLSAGDEPHDINKEFVCDYVVSDAVTRQRMLSYFISDYPLLERVSVSDLGKRGSISVSSGRVIHQLRNKLDNNTMEVMSECRIKVLKLPGSGCVMKGVNLVLLHRKDDTFENMDFDDEFEDGLEAVYTEAMKEIVTNHRRTLVMRIIPRDS